VVDTRFQNSNFQVEDEQNG